MAEYKNPWHNPRQDMDGPAFFQTEAKPKEYRGYLIYNRIEGPIGRGVWDIVKDRACVSQRAGPNGARRKVDELIEGGASG